MCVASSARGSAERRARGTLLPEAGSAAALSAAEGLPALAARGGSAPGRAGALTLRCCAGSLRCVAFVRGGRRWRWSPPRSGSPSRRGGSRPRPPSVVTGDGACAGVQLHRVGGGGTGPRGEPRRAGGRGAAAPGWERGEAGERRPRGLRGSPRLPSCHELVGPSREVRGCRY